MQCACCRADDELRYGICFDCANDGEAKAARRTVYEHLRCAVRNLAARNSNWRFDIRWAWERLCLTGDYAPGGYFERAGHLKPKT